MSSDFFPPNPSPYTPSAAITCLALGSRDGRFDLRIHPHWTWYRRGIFQTPLLENWSRIWIFPCVYIYILYTLIFFFHQVTASFVEKAFCNIYLISKSGAASSNWNTSMDLLLEPIYLDMWTVRNHYCNMYDNDSRWSLCGWLNHPLVCCVPSGCWVSWTLIWMFQLELVNGIRRHGIYIPTSGLVYTLIHPYT